VSVYELAILGHASPHQREALIKTIEVMLGDFGLKHGLDVTLHDSETLVGRDKHAAFVAAYFGGITHADRDAVFEIVKSSSPIIPTIDGAGDFGLHIPDFLQGANGLRRRDNDVDMAELATAMLECVGLLRRQRRVFVSYRRIESREAALQLYDLLNSRGFDVFLDTHEIRPGDPFQDVLWHRLCDSDVMVMLDTPSYVESRWTR